MLELISLLDHKLLLSDMKDTKYSEDDIYLRMMTSLIEGLFGSDEANCNKTHAHCNEIQYTHN